jgi:hypothetical protein
MTDGLSTSLLMSHRILAELEERRSRELLQ